MANITITMKDDTVHNFLHERASWWKLDEGTKLSRRVAQYYRLPKL